MKLELCAQCHQNYAKYHCKLCKRGYCDQCLDRKTLLCRNCINVHGTHRSFPPGEYRTG